MSRVVPVPVELYRGRIWAKVPFRLKDTADAIPGARKIQRPSGWVTTYPATMATCHALRGAFGAGLEVGPGLAQWARDEVARMGKLEAFRDGDGSAADLSGLIRRAPVLHSAMLNRPYQLDGTAFLSEGGNVCLGDAPGLGKTLQCLGALVNTNRNRVLVSCPVTAATSVWLRGTKQWLGDEAIVHVAQGTRLQRLSAIAEFTRGAEYDRYGLEENAKPVRILVINTEMLQVKRYWNCPAEYKGDKRRWDKPPGRKGGCPASHKHKVQYEEKYPELFRTEWDAIVLDESHHALASTHNRNSANITQVRLGAVRLPLAAGGMTLAMSGTPFRSKLTKAWGTLNWLRPDAFTSFWSFAEEHFKVGTDGYAGARTIGPIRDQGAFNDALRPYYLARTKAQVAKDLPPIVYAGTPAADHQSFGSASNGVYLPMTGDQFRAYAEMRRLATATISNGKLTAIGVLAELTRLKQFACAYGRLEGDGDSPSVMPEMPSNKIEWILEFLAQREGNDGKVIIASQFTRLIELMAKVIRTETGGEVLTLTGKTSRKNRDVLQERFQDPSDPCRLAIINTYAGGEAITLDADCDDMIMTDEPWTSDAIEQVESRIHRVSRIHNVTVYRLRSEDSVDEWIAGLTAEQREVIAAAKPIPQSMLEGL